MKIQRTGLQNYLPDGEANMKAMVIGGPGVGKTRWSSGWPEPFYLNVEAGLSSVADREVPYTDIDSSEDMLQALKWLKQSREARVYGTAIVDTFDAFQRKVKQEWLDANPAAEAFSGYDAWGYLDGKMQMLMTRLLSLPMNVIVLVHYKDKTYTEKVGGTDVERHEYLLQLQGDIKDTAFNDFDLVGWMDTFWKPNPEGGGKIEVPGITFTRTPDKPFLKDRLNITPRWLEISLDGDELESNYLRLFERFMARLDDLKDGEAVGEIPDLPDENAVDASGVAKPARGGPVAPQDPREMPLDQFKKPELIEMARAIPSIKDQVKTSMLKDEIIALIEQGRADEEAKPQEPAQEPETEAKAEATEAPAADTSEAQCATCGDKKGWDENEKWVRCPDCTEAPAETESETGSDATSASADQADTTSSTPVEGTDEAEAAPAEATEAPAEPEPEPEPAPEPEPEAVTPAAEPAETEEEQSDTPEPAAAQEAAEEAPEHVCEIEGCGKDLAGENKDYVKLAWIKYRQKLCNEHYIERKKKG